MWCTWYRSIEAQWSVVLQHDSVSDEAGMAAFKHSLLLYCSSASGTMWCLWYCSIEAQWSVVLQYCGVRDEAALVCAMRPLWRCSIEGQQSNVLQYERRGRSGFAALKSSRALYCDVSNEVDLVRVRVRSS